MNTTLQIPLLLLSLALLCAPAAAKGSPIRNKSSLDSAQKRAEKKIFDYHLKLAKAFEKKSLPWEAWVEVQSAVRLLPEDKRALKLLPSIPPPPPTKASEEASKARTDHLKQATEELVDLLARAEAGGLPNAELEGIALRILSYDIDQPAARKALGFIGSAESWTNARRSMRIGNVKLALSRIPAPTASDRDFKALSAALGKPLQVYKSAHAYYATTSTSADSIARLARAAEAAYDIIHHDLYGISEHYKDGDPRTPTGVKLAPYEPALYLVLDGLDEHKLFLDKVVTDANLKVRGTSLGFCATGFAPEKVVIFESRNGERFIEEWGALNMASRVLGLRFGKHRPEYLVQGAARYYSGLVSEQTQLRVVASGTMSDEDERRMKVGSYLLLCWTARWAYENFRAPLPAEWGLRKPIDAMNQGDVGPRRRLRRLPPQHQTRTALPAPRPLRLHENIRRRSLRKSLRQTQARSRPRLP